MIGQLIETFSSGKMAALYVARIVSGLGIGPLTVTGPMPIVEIAPTEFHGLLSFWFGIVLLLSLMVANPTVHATFVRVSHRHCNTRSFSFSLSLSLYWLL